MPEYVLMILDEDGNDVGKDIPLADYLAGNKNPSQLFDEINNQIDSYESDEDEDDRDD